VLTLRLTPWLDLVALKVSKVMLSPVTADWLELFVISIKVVGLGALEPLALGNTRKVMEGAP
jgi:hypothetical protein